MLLFRIVGTLLRPRSSEHFFPVIACCRVVWCRHRLRCMKLVNALSLFFLVIKQCSIKYHHVRVSPCLASLVFPPFLATPEFLKSLIPPPLTVDDFPSRVFPHSFCGNVSRSTILSVQSPTRAKTPSSYRVTSQGGGMITICFKCVRSGKRYPLKEEK